MSIKGRSSLDCSSKIKSRMSIKRKRSKSITDSVLLKTNGIKNIGSLDELGNFRLDPNLQSSLETETLSYWEKFKQDYMQRSTVEVMNEAKKILAEVFSEITVNSPKEHRDSLKHFFNETI